MSEEINEELLGEMKRSVPYVAAVLLIVAGYYGVKNYLADRKASASAAVTSAYTTEELEEAVGKYGDTMTGPALKLKLAKKYFDTARYEAALEIYEELSGKTGEAFGDIPTVGKAETLEALGRTEEARKIYEDFAAAKPDNYLALTAKLGAVRCVALGDKETALARLADLKESVKDDETAAARVAALEDVIKRR